MVKTLQENTCSKVYFEWSSYNEINDKQTHGTIFVKKYWKLIISRAKRKFKIKNHVTNI